MSLAECQQMATLVLFISIAV